MRGPRGASARSLIVQEIIRERVSVTGLELGPHLAEGLCFELTDPLLRAPEALATAFQCLGLLLQLAGGKDDPLALAERIEGIGEPAAKGAGIRAIGDQPVGTWSTIGRGFDPFAPLPRIPLRV